MKIAIDAREMVGQIAGKGRYVAEVVKGLAAIDEENTYYLYSKQPLTEKLPKNFHVVIIGGLPGLRQLWLARDAKKKGCDLLFAPTGYLPVVFSLIPTIVTVHDLALFMIKEARPALKTLIAERLLLGLAVRRSKRIIAVSQSTKQDLMDYFRVPDRKINITLLGYDKAVYQPKDSGDETILKHYGLQPGYLLFVGTLEPRKNVVGIITAYSQLPPELRAAHKLVIGGKKGWFYEEIFAKVAELELEREISFLGRVPDEHLPALYRQAAAFVFPSFYEGFGLPIVEALACGTPVITAQNSSLPEVAGTAALYAEAHDPKTISQAMRNLLTDKELAKKLRSQTLVQAANFDWQQTASQTLAIFKEVANAK